VGQRDWLVGIEGEVCFDLLLGGGVYGAPLDSRVLGADSSKGTVSQGRHGRIPTQIPQMALPSLML